MNSRTPLVLAVLAASALADGQTTSMVQDDLGDACPRVMDPAGSLSQTATVPDIIQVSMSTWTTTTPTTNPYSGSPIAWQQAHLIRLDAVFDGLVNPAGPTDGVTIHEPFMFGDNPVYAFIDIDMDGRKDTGGQVGGAATLRYLANVGRFGRVPYGSIGERAARDGDDIDFNFNTGPQYERSGADFVLIMCGCATSVIISETGNMDGKLDAGETMIVKDRFFARTTGYTGASFVTGGSATWHYDPKVNLRFSHSTTTDQTTVSLVFPLDMAGHQMLSGSPTTPPVNYNVADAFSIEEAFQDTIDYYELFTPNQPTLTLTDAWEGRDPDEAFNPSEWRITALVGMPYINVTPNGSRFSWTDTAGNEEHADVEGDGLANASDESAVRTFVYAHDGTGADADGMKDGRFTIASFGLLNFAVEDLDGNGIVEGEDLWAYGHRADFTGEGTLDFFDFLLFQSLFAMQDPKADFNLDQVFDFFDFLEFQTAFAR